MLGKKPTNLSSIVLYPSHNQSPNYQLLTLQKHVRYAEQATKNLEDVCPRLCHNNIFNVVSYETVQNIQDTHNINWNILPSLYIFLYDLKDNCQWV